MSIIEIEKSRMWLKSFFSTIKELSPKARNERIAVIRRIAGDARNDKEAHAVIKYLLANIEFDMPLEAKTFRAYYLDGDIRQSARSIGRILHVDKATVHRHNRRVINAMLPLMFGLDGIFELKPVKSTGEAV